jgi:hypothetical protein
MHKNPSYLGAVLQVRPSSQRYGGYRRPAGAGGPQPIVRYPGQFVLAGASTTATGTWSSPPLFGFPRT